MKLNVMKTILAATLISGIALADLPVAPKAGPVIPMEPKGTDFAQLEYKHPLTPAQLGALTPENLEAMALEPDGQEKIDQIYARLTAGPIPDGPLYGKVVFARDGGMERISQFVKTLGFKMDMVALKKFAEALWNGKHFYRNERTLRNLISDFGLLQTLVSAPLEKEIVGSLPKAAQEIIKGLPQKKVDGKMYWEVFPAKLHCGLSLLDSRRESVIIDYAFTDEVEGYHRIPDSLAGRTGLRVRDEIRMVRPGFYLGRAYMDHQFVLTFLLYNEKLAKQVGPVEEDCWIGTQARR